MTSHIKALEPLILNALKSGQMHIRMLCGALDRGHVEVGSTIAELVRRGEVSILGTARGAGYKDVNANAQVFGLPGTGLVKAPKPVKRRSSSGSGQIAGFITVGRGSRWGAGV